LIRINLVLIRAAPLQYLQEVAQGFSTFWLPASTNLVNMSSRGIQLLWAVIHFGLMSLFGGTLIVLLGSAVFLIKARPIFEKGDLSGVFEMRLIQKQAAVYALAGTIVMYGAVISSLFESGNPRYRIPTDILIVYMSFLGIDLFKRLSRITTVSLSGPKSFRAIC
jgi:hypothetical protein